MGRHIIDLTGQYFGKWEVLRKAKTTPRIYWLCKCVCGSLKEIQGGALRAKNSSGCLRCAKTTHGLSRRPRTLEYRLWSEAKYRARKGGYKFTLKPADIFIPKKCPLLDVILSPGHRKHHDCSPSLDRKNPNHGYTLKNTWVISHKANRIKNNATLQELKTLVQNLQRNWAQ